MPNVKLIWSTPNIEDIILECCRPQETTPSKDPVKLINYLMKHHHWSPFEMASVCLEINTTRDIARQILRHRSFSFQEFSQRYAKVTEFTDSEVRLQDTKNRQNSLPTEDKALQSWWAYEQACLLDNTTKVYDLALKKGIAKEVARKILPEGLTNSRMFMTGTLRSWLHYISIRMDAATQKEHRQVAEQCSIILSILCPSIMEAFYA